MSRGFNRTPASCIPRAVMDSLTAFAQSKLDALEAEQSKGSKRLDAETLARVREALYGG